MPASPTPVGRSLSPPVAHQEPPRQTHVHYPESPYAIQALLMFRKPHPGTIRSGVPVDIGERLLHHPKERHLEIRTPTGENRIDLHRSSDTGAF